MMRLKTDAGRRLTLRFGDRPRPAYRLTLEQMAEAVGAGLEIVVSAEAGQVVATYAEPLRRDDGGGGSGASGTRSPGRGVEDDGGTPARTNLR